MRVADYIASFVYDLGVKDVFLLSGGGMMHLQDGIAAHGKLKYICHHHEQAAAMAAEAYARATENYGVGYFTTGPGATNAITGLVGAWQDSAPLICISGQSKRSQTIHNSGLKNLRQFGVQEVNIIPLVETITKYAVLVREAETIRYHLEKAAYIAKHGRPGPVWLDIPLDIQGAQIEPDKLKSFARTELADQYNNELMANDVAMAAQLLKTAKRPVIIAGQGVRLARGMADLRRLIERYHLPLTTTRVGIDIIESDHPLFIGRPGITGDRPANLSIQNADLILTIGSRLSVSSVGHEYKKFGREAKIVVVDIDLDEHKKQTIRIDQFIKADAKKFINQLSQELTKIVYEGVAKSWLQRCRGWKKKYPVMRDHGAGEGVVDYYYFIDKLCDAASENSIILSDAGSAFYVTSQAVKIKKGQRYIVSGAIAAMGYTLPAAIGAAVASPDKMILGITGDGSFQLNIQELQVLAHHGLPVKLFVVNNNGYLSIRNTEKNFFGRFIGEGPKSGVSCPDTLKIAKAYGIKAVRVSDSTKLEATIKEVFAHKGPIICEIMTPEWQLIAPKVSSIKKQDGTMASRPLEDMSPLLDRKEFLDNMIVAPLEESRS